MVNIESNQYNAVILDVIKWIVCLSTFFYGGALLLAI